MYEFDIRVTGTIDSSHEETSITRDKLHAIAGELFVNLVAEGAKVGSITLNGTSVSIARVEPAPSPDISRVPPAPSPVQQTTSISPENGDVK